MPDLAPIRAALNTARELLEISKKAGVDEPWIALYVRDVAALLAALDAKAQKEGGETCSDCPPAGYPTDKTRCDECPRRAQKEDGER